MALPTPDLQKKSVAIALDAVARGDPAPVERRALLALAPNVEWNAILLRNTFEQTVAIYDPAGEIEVVIDRAGKLWSFEDPRHAPAGKEVHIAEQQAIAAVRPFLGEPPGRPKRGEPARGRAAAGQEPEIELEAEFVRRKDGTPLLRVKNRTPKVMDSKFFQRKEEDEPEGPPPDRVEAEVNADTGKVFRFRREPAPPKPPAAAGEAKK